MSREDSSHDDTKWDGLTLGKSWAATQAHRDTKCAMSLGTGPRGLGQLDVHPQRRRPGSWHWEGGRSLTLIILKAFRCRAGS